jgi:hypothetical protein
MLRKSIVMAAVVLAVLVWTSAKIALTAAMPASGQLGASGAPGGIVSKAALVCEPWGCYRYPEDWGWYRPDPYWSAWRRHYWPGWQPQSWWGWHQHHR